MVDLGFKYPIAVSGLGMGFASLFAFIYCDILGEAKSCVSAMKFHICIQEIVNETPVPGYYRGGLFFHMGRCTLL